MSLTVISPQSRTILAPLTTLFVQPQTCSRLIAGFADVTQSEFFAGQQCGTGTPIDATQCWPTATVNPAELPFNGFGFYSPGLICPQNYITACGAAVDEDDASGTSAVSGLPFYNFQYSLTAGETAYGCCPIGMSCSLDTVFRTAQTCVRTIGTSGGPRTISTIAARCDASGNLVSTSVVKSLAVLKAPLFQINHRSVDISAASTGSDAGLVLPGSSTATTTSTSSSTSSSSSLSSSSSTANPDNTNTATSSTDLPLTTKLGIGLGVGLGAALLLAALVFLAMKRRSARKSSRNEANQFGDGQGSAYVNGYGYAPQPGLALDEPGGYTHTHMHHGGQGMQMRSS